MRRAEVFAFLYSCHCTKHIRELLLTFLGDMGHSGKKN